MTLFHELWQTIQQVVYSSTDQTQLTNNTVSVLVRVDGIRFVEMGLFLLATLFHPYWWRCLELRRITQPPTTVISFSNSTRYTDNVYNTAVYSSPGPDRSLAFFHRGSKTADKKEKRPAGPLFRQKHDARCEARNNVTVQLLESRPAGPTMAMKSSMSADWQRCCCWWHLCTEDVWTWELQLRDTYNNWETTVVCKNTATLFEIESRTH